MWTYLVLARGMFWKIEAPKATRPDSESVHITVIIPARNEADVIAACISSLLQQTTRASLHIVLVDDNSSDRTAQIALETAGRLGRPESLTVIDGQTLPSGWSGKQWALQQGIQHARQFAPDFLLFTDADVAHDPTSVATLIALAEREHRELVSLMVKLHCETLAEKLLIPAFVYFFFKLYPPAWIGNAHRRTAGAAGGCILLRPAALDRAGGIDAIRSEIIDDCALARVVKRSGGNVYLGAASSTHSIRRYGSFAEIGRMIARTAFNQLHHSVLLLAATLIGLVLTYVAPVALLFSGHTLPIILGATATALMIGSYLPMVRFYGLSPLWAGSIPLAAIFYMGATLKSALNYWSGRGGQWKGRAQDSRVPQEGTRN